MSLLLGHQPAFKELWLDEMFSCAKASLEMSQGNSGEAQGLARLECLAVSTQRGAGARLGEGRCSVPPPLPGLATPHPPFHLISLLPPQGLCTGPSPSLLLSFTDFPH